MMELGMWKEAHEQLDLAWRSRLYFPGPEHFEEHSGLRVVLAEFYQGKLAERQGRREDARQRLSNFLWRFPADRVVLPQVEEARRMLARL